MASMARVARVRLQKPNDVRKLLQDMVNRVKNAKPEEYDMIDKQARTITYIANVMLTAMKEGEIEDRLAALEEQAAEQGKKGR